MFKYLFLCAAILLNRGEAHAYYAKTDKALIDTGNIKVYTDFSGGSAKVTGIDQVSRTIRLVPESNPDRGWECWWYFRVEGLEPGSMVTFEVGANSFGLPDRAQFSYDNKIWKQIDEPGERKGRLLMIYRHKFTAPTIWFAWGPPFVLQHAGEVLKAAINSGYGKGFELAKTLGGNSVPAVLISQKGLPENNRPVIWVQARQHAWESGASWVCSGFIEWLISDEPLAEQLRKTALVYFVPVMDVDNVELGAGGKDQQPHDQNRDWSASPHFPEVRAAMNHISTFNAKGRFSVFIDLHNPGASNKEVFFYVPAKPLLVSPRVELQNEFFNLVGQEMTGPAGFNGKLGDIGETYNPDTDTTSDSWVANHTNSKALSLTMETPWNVADGTQNGYLKRGAELGRSVARYRLKK